jgi:hypothetical protein
MIVRRNDLRWTMTQGAVRAIEELKDSTFPDYPADELDQGSHYGSFGTGSAMR